MIIDAVPFFNENDLWQLRYETLKDVVDYFVVVEARHTHSGQPKDVGFAWSDDERIVHHVMDLPDPGMAGIPATRRREMTQRNELSFALDWYLDLDDDDIILISDCDEIPHPDRVASLRQTGIPDGAVLTFQQLFFYYNVNTISTNMHWFGTRAANWRDVKALTPHVVRYGLGGGDALYPLRGIYQQGGWHCSYFGGVERIQAKLTNFLHQELVNDRITDAAYLEARIKRGDDLFLRANDAKFAIRANADVPPPMRSDPARWRGFWHPDYAPGDADHG